MAVNTDFPFPQADRLGKVAVVIDAVGAGVDTVVGIAEALEMVDRQGAYYVAAAGYLGLLERLDTIPATYALTPEGRDMLAAGPNVRGDLILQAVADVPEVGIFLRDATAGVREFYQDAGLDEETATRRATTIAAWTATVTGPGLPAQVTAADAHAVATAAAVIRERVARRRAAAPVCPVCFLQMPSGLTECPNC